MALKSERAKQKGSYPLGVYFLDKISSSSLKPPVEIRDKQDEREKGEEREQKNFNLRILGFQGKHRQDESVCLILCPLDVEGSDKYTKELGFLSKLNQASQSLTPERPQLASQA